MKILKFPFLSLSIFFVLGILSYPISGTYLFLLLVFGLVTVAAFAFGTRSLLFPFFRGCYWVFYAISFWCIGGLTAALHTTALQSQHYSHKVEPDKKAFMSMVVREKWKASTFAYRYLAEISVVDQETAFGKVLIVIPKKHAIPEPKVGEVIKVYQSVSPIARPLNPHQFDYRSYLEKQGIYGQIYLDPSNFKTDGKRSDFQATIANWRDQLIEGFEIHSFSPDVNAIVHSLLFGQRQELSDDLNTSFKRVGVVHVLAISGLHIGIIYLFLVHVLRRMGLGNRLIYVMAVFVLWFFALLSGFAAPVVRAVMVFTLFGLIQWVRRVPNSYNSLAISFFIMLCFNPFYIYEVGFQLSFLSVFSILYFYPILQRYTHSKWLVWRYFKEIIGVSLAVQIGILPLTIYYFHYLPVFFLVGNCLVVPLVTVILGSLIVLLGLNYIWEALAVLFGKIVSVLIELMNGIVAFLSRFAEFNLGPVFFNAVLALIGLAVLIVLGYVLKVRERRYIMPLLGIVLVFQLVYIGYVVYDVNQREVLLLFDRNNTTLLSKERGSITLYSSDAAVLSASSISDYCNRHVVLEKSYTPLMSFLTVKGKRVLIVDSLGFYQTNVQADVILFVDRPKINFRRVIEFHQPELVLVGSGFFGAEKEGIRAVCSKKNIPFHSVSEKGYFKF